MTKVCQQKVCIACGREYQPTSNAQMYCPTCGPDLRHELKNAHDREYYASHREEMAEFRRMHPDLIRARSAAQKLRHPETAVRYRATHIEERAEYNAKYYAEHKEQQADWRYADKLKNPEKYRERERVYTAAHPEKVLARQQTYVVKHPEKVREIRKRHHVKRIRQLGFIPINTPREGYEAHHLDKEHVVYVPHDLHRSIPHNVFTGKNMDAINDAIVAWFTSP